MEIPDVVHQDEKVSKLEAANANLSASPEEAVIEIEEKATTISRLEKTVQNILEKLDKSEQSNLKDLELKDLKQEEIDCVKVQNKNLLSESKTLRKFFGACVCRVTFKHLPQPLRSHIQSFGTLGQLLKFSKKNF